jgi:hypothetical protein
MLNPSWDAQYDATLEIKKAKKTISSNHLFFLVMESKGFFLVMESHWSSN